MLGLFCITSSLAQFVPDRQPQDVSWGDLLRPIYDAFAGGRYQLMGALAVVLLVAVVKRVFGPKVSWLHSDAGGTGMALVGAVASALAAGLVAPGASITFSLLKASLVVGVTAAGGYAVLKNLLIDPVLRPLAAKTPAWAQPFFNAVFWIFEHPQSDPVQVAETAGAAAVMANPGAGVAGVVGQPTDLK
jgi:hypothetical protein